MTTKLPTTLIADGTAGELLTWGASGTTAKVATGTSGQVLTSNGAGLAPTFGTLGVAGGGTGATTLTDGGVLIGNATGAIQVTSAGTAGQVLTSNGAGVDPTFQAAGGGGGAWTYGSATPSGTNFTIASGLASVSELEIFFSSMTATGTQGFLVRLGDSGGIEASGYVGFTNIATLTAGIAQGTCGAQGYEGFLRLSLVDNANRWASHFSGGNSTTIEHGAVIKNLSSTLTQIDVARTSGATFNGGTVYFRRR